MKKGKISPALVSGVVVGLVTMIFCSYNTFGLRYVLLSKSSDWVSNCNHKETQMRRICLVTRNLCLIVQTLSLGGFSWIS